MSARSQARDERHLELREVRPLARGQLRHGFLQQLVVVSGELRPHTHLLLCGVKPVHDLF